MMYLCKLISCNKCTTLVTMWIMEMLGDVENGDAVWAEGIWKCMYLLLSFAVNNKTTPKTRETIMRSTHSCEGMEEREFQVKEIACSKAWQW